MSHNQASALAASIRDRLLNIARANQEDFQGVLIRYAIERLLYRVYQSQYRDKFVLKGAMLFVLWSQEPHRATQDLDLLCYGDNTVTHLEQVFREIGVWQRFVSEKDTSLKTSRHGRFRDHFFNFLDFA
jgi:predicted nucleotidyltransferase component of viral defense system